MAGERRKMKLKSHRENEAIGQWQAEGQPDLSRSPARALAPHVTIRQRGSSVTQSGRARADIWILEFDPRYRPSIDFLMGWTGSRDTLRQVQMWFRDESDAIAFAEREGYQYAVERTPKRNVKPKSYVDNFRHRDFE